MSRQRNKIQPAYIRPEYGTLAQVGFYAGCSSKQIRRLIAAGLPAYRFGDKGHLRVRFTDLDEWMERECRVMGNVDQLVDEIVSSLGE
jgi:excisionase family DNA binding protein